MANPTLVAGSVQTDTDTGSGLNWSWPTLQEGDVCYVLIARPVGSSFSAPSGYTTIGSTGSGNASGALHKKVQGSTPDTTFSGPVGNSNYPYTAVGFVFRGISSATQEDVAVVTSTGTGGAPNPGSATPVTLDTVSIVCGTADIADTSVVAPTNYTLLGGTGSTGSLGSSCVHAAYRNLTTTAAQDPAGFTSWSASGWIAFHVLLRPPGVNGVVAPTETQDTADAVGAVAHYISLVSNLANSNTAGGNPSIT